MSLDVSDIAERVGFAVPVSISPGLEQKLDAMRCTVMDFESKVSLLLAHTRIAIRRATGEVCTFRFPVNERIYSATVRMTLEGLYIANWGEGYEE